MSTVFDLSTSRQFQRGGHEGWARDAALAALARGEVVAAQLRHRPLRPRCPMALGFKTDEIRRVISVETTAA
jgi:hypothetical protein